MNRRDLLRGALPTVIAAGGAAAVHAASAQAGDGLAALWAQRERCRLWCCMGGLDDDEVDRRVDVLTKIEERMIGTPASSVDGMRFKLRLLDDYLSLLSGLAGDALDALVEDAERLAGDAA